MTVFAEESEPESESGSGSGCGSTDRRVGAVAVAVDLRWLNLSGSSFIRFRSAISSLRNLLLVL